MLNWFKTYWKDNDRTSTWITDFRSESELDSSIFVNPLDEAVAVVREITSKYPPPYSLMLSGGIDSQAMVWAWQTSGEPFTIYHWSYNKQNDHDTEWAVKFVETYNLQKYFRIENFDASGFITSPELVQYAVKYDTVSPQMLTYIKLVENTPGTVIMAGNFLTKSFASINYTLYGLKRFAEIARHNFIPFFFLSNPRLAYAFYKECETLHSAVNDTHVIRGNIYKNCGFPVITPDTGKFTGFEYIKASFDTVRISHIDKLRAINYPSKRNFDILYRYKLFEQVPKYTERTEIIHHNFIKTL
jgi:hypothetical protein